MLAHDLNQLAADLLAGLSPGVDQVQILLLIGSGANNTITITTLSGGTTVNEVAFIGSGTDIDTFLEGFTARHNI